MGTLSKKTTGEQEQKSSPDKSDELLNIVRRYFRSVDLTYLSRLWRDGIGTFPHFVRNDKVREVVKASKGHYPQPFLISSCKELAYRQAGCCKERIQDGIFQI